MTQYIDKAAVETELQRRLKSHKEEIEKYSPFHHNLVIDIIGKKQECNDILSFLNTLEVKEVDLEAAIKDYFDNQPIITRSKGVNYKLIPSGEDIAKHFFELGLNAK